MAKSVDTGMGEKAGPVIQSSANKPACAIPSVLAPYLFSVG